MQKLLKSLVIGTALLLVGGCDYLDYDETSGRTKEEAYGYFDNIKSLVSYVYAQLPQDLGTVNGAMMESATDNSVYTWEDNKIYYLNNATWSPLRIVDDAWDLWKGIRAANSFLENFDIEVLKRFEFESDYENWMKSATLFPYEVRLLRAFYFLNWLNVMVTSHY